MPTPIRFTLIALLALAPTLAVQAGTEMKDNKDMKQMSQTSCASDAGFYVAVYGGANFSTNFGDRHTSFGPGGSTTPDNIHSEVGGVGGIKGGYNFRIVRSLRSPAATAGGGGRSDVHWHGQQIDAVARRRAGS